MFLNWQFQYPEALWLLVLTPLFVFLFLAYLRWKKRSGKRAGDKPLISQLLRSYSGRKSLLKFIVLLVAFIFGCLALANPRRPSESTDESRKGIDVVIALDVSYSMLATDVSPTRLAKAKQLVLDLMDKMPNDRVGLVVFAGNAYQQMPLTFDQEAIRLYLGTAGPGQVPTQGTSIGDALNKCNRMFVDASRRFGSVILITDGETHDEDALKAASELAKKGIMVNTVGIGSTEGSTITDSSGHQKRDAAGQVVITKLNEALLQQIASRTNGTYVHLDNTETAAVEIFNTYSHIETKALGDTTLLSYESFYLWASLPMLLLLLTEIFIPDRKKSVQ